jgi:hypothetical protein
MSEKKKPIKNLIHKLFGSDRVWITIAYGVLAIANSALGLGIPDDTLHTIGGVAGALVVGKSLRSTTGETMINRKPEDAE